MIIGWGFLPNVKLGDDIWIWESFIIYQVLYLMLKAEAIVGPMAKFLTEVTILIKAPSRMYEIRHRGLRNPLEVKFSYTWTRVIPRSENSR